MNSTSNSELITRAIAEQNEELTRQAQLKVRGLISEISVNLKIIESIKKVNESLREQLRKVEIRPVVASEILGG